MHASVSLGHRSFWRWHFAFSGPGYLFAVGYMDPGNWATDIAEGSCFGYSLLCVVLLSNLMAILLQALAVRLGVATGRDLAQAAAIIIRGPSPSRSGCSASSPSLSVTWPR